MDCLSRGTLEHISLQLVGQIASDSSNPYTLKLFFPNPVQFPFVAIKTINDLTARDTLGGFPESCSFLGSQNLTKNQKIRLFTQAKYYIRHD